MATVYTVWSGEYSDVGMHSAWSTQEMAEAEVLRRDREHYCKSFIEEFVVDDVKHERTLTSGYYCEISESGRVLKTGDGMNWARNGDRGEAGDTYDDGFWAVSPISAEHAMKLAVEARQAHLRKCTEAGQ